MEASKLFEIMASAVGDKSEGGKKMTGEGGRKHTNRMSANAHEGFLNR